MIRQILIATLFIGLAGIVWYVLAEPQQEEFFAHEGNLIHNNPGLVPNTWYLSYEEPGSSGLVVPLVFDSASLCGAEGALTTCNISFEQGERVRIEGEIIGGNVRVATLRYIAPQEAAMTVYLYYYDPEKDTDEEGNIRCSPAGLVYVERLLPQGTTLEDAIKLHLRGELSDEERAQGITTEFPLEGISLVSANVENGIATLTFDDPLHKTGGGACRVGVLWEQISATAMQFPGITDVLFEPEELFQP